MLYPLSYEGGACRKPGRKLSPGPQHGLSDFEFTYGNAAQRPKDAVDPISGAPKLASSLRWGCGPLGRSERWLLAGRIWGYALDRLVVPGHVGAALSFRGGLVPGTGAQPR